MKPVHAARWLHMSCKALAYINRQVGVFSRGEWRAHAALAQPAGHELCRRTRTSPAFAFSTTMLGVSSVAKSFFIII
jgi:hypothetical protein